MFTFVFVLKENGVVYVRIYKDGKKSELSLRIKADKVEFDEAMITKARKAKTPLRANLDAIELRLRNIQSEMIQGGASFRLVKEIRNYIKASLFGETQEAQPEQEVDSRLLFAPYFEKCTEGKINRGYKATYEFTRKKIEAFCSSDGQTPYRELLLTGINLKWLNALDEWLTEKKLSRNSRNIVFKNIRTVINRAIDDELIVSYPFRRFKIQAEETRKRSLSVRDLRRLFDYPCEPYQEFYRDMFKLIFMLCGINTIDLYNLKTLRDGFAEYRRAKTKRLYSVKVEPEAMEIIEKYRGQKNLLCIADRWKDDRDFNKNMNIALKKIGKLSRTGRGGKKEIKPLFPDISTYWARHSWATIAASLDIPKDTIAHALGHGKNTVTDIYIDFDHAKVDEANRKVLDWVLYHKK